MNAPPSSLKELDSHPLNRAAQVLLRRSGHQPGEKHPGLMPLLLLATEHLSEANELDDRLPLLARWGSNPENQAKALSRLEAGGLNPQDLLAGTPEQGAEQVIAELAPYSQPVLS